MTEKRLFFALLALFALSAAYLFSVNERGLNPDHAKSWWSLSFAEPNKESSLVFIVSNHTDTADFRYTVTTENETLDAGEFSVERGSDMTRVPTVRSLPTSDRITITVTHDGKEETIYRSL